MMLATLEGGNGHLSMPGIVNRGTLNSALCLVAPAVLFGGLAGGGLCSNVVGSIDAESSRQLHRERLRG